MKLIFTKIENQMFTPAAGVYIIITIATELTLIEENSHGQNIYISDEKIERPRVWFGILKLF